MNKYSQGEWRACCLDNKPHFVFAGEDKAVCSIFHNDPNEPNYESMEGIVTKEECVANAKLIQAAPDLLAALQKALSNSHFPGNPKYHGWLDDASNAIKKAI